MSFSQFTTQSPLNKKNKQNYKFIIILYQKKMAKVISIIFIKQRVELKHLVVFDELFVDYAKEQQICMQLHLQKAW